MKRKYEKVFHLNPESSPLGIKNVFVRGFVEHLVRLNKLNKIVSEGRSVEEREGQCFSDRILEGMNVKVNLSEEDLARIPKTGPVVVVANHPFGGIEGVVLMSILNKVRPDYKVLVNYILEMVPEMRGNFIGVDVFGSQQAAKKNVRPLMETMKWVKEGHILGVFPSGEVSSIDLKSRRIRDPKWQDTIGGIIRKTGATVIPMYFAGANPARFQMAGLIHPRLRTVMLPSMVANKRKMTFEVAIGAPVLPSEVKKYESDEDLMKYLRLRSYSLEGRFDGKKKRFCLFKKSKPKTIKHQPIIEETPAEAIEAEIKAFAPEAHLFTGGDLEVYISKLGTESAIMRELSRLREITFRSVGEGTGLEKDTDVYDAQYLHLFIWNAKAKEIVGAYRLGLADEICKKFGPSGLYTHTLFKFDESLTEKILPGIELGRSFVRPEYQKAFQPLLYLWKGIGMFISRNPQYVNLFGPVSITADYKDTSRNMLLRSLELSNFANDLAHLVKPRNKPARMKKREEWVNPDFEEIIASVDDVSTLIQDIEDDRKSIPVLIKQYLKLGGKILAFNLDEEFSDVVDGLILIDLRKTDKRTRRRYMGDEADDAFCKYHGLE